MWQAIKEKALIMRDLDFSLSFFNFFVEFVNGGIKRLYHYFVFEYLQER